MKNFPLDKKRRFWAEQFKPTAVVRGLPASYPVAVEKYYINAVEKLLHYSQGYFEKEITRLFKSPLGREYFTTDESLSSQTRILINKLTREIEQFAAEQADKIADRFVRNLNATNASVMHKSFETISGGLKIKTSAITKPVAEQLKTAVNVNSSLIKSIASSSLDKLTDATYRSIMTGQGLADLVPFFRKHEEITARHARNVALDQTRKAYTGLTTARMQNVGMSKFEWKHSGGGQKPREYHRERWPNGLNGGIFDINDPPIIDKKTGERGLPGHAINCKCVMVPVLEFDDGEEV